MISDLEISSTIEKGETTHVPNKSDIKLLELVATGSQGCGRFKSGRNGPAAIRGRAMLMM
eukprot:SAG11_NODE_7992_length_1072_cov_1.494347_2_plen_59_part_01